MVSSLALTGTMCRGVPGELIAVKKVQVFDMNSSTRSECITEVCARLGEPAPEPHTLVGAKAEARPFGRLESGRAKRVDGAAVHARPNTGANAVQNRTGLRRVLSSTAP